MRQQLEICNRNIGSSPREIKPLDKKYVLPKAPEWAKYNSLNEVIRDRELLLEQGKVVLSARIIAMYPFYEGSEDTELDVIWSDDAFFEDEPEELLRIALIMSEMVRKVYAAKNGDEKDIARRVSGDRTRSLSVARGASRFADSKSSGLSIDGDRLPKTSGGWRP